MLVSSSDISNIVRTNWSLGTVTFSFSTVKWPPALPLACEALSPCEYQFFGHLMRPAHTHESAHRVDLAARPSPPARRQLVRRVQVAMPAARHGADGGRCRVGPGRGARLSTDPFPRAALRTRRAGHPGTGLSTRPATDQRLRCRSAPQYPAWTARSGRRYSPAAAALPTRRRRLAVPFAVCTPLACSDSDGHAATTRHHQPTTRLPAARRRRGRRRVACHVHHHPVDE
jgi:hypothetical protein